MGQLVKKFLGTAAAIVAALLVGQLLRLGWRLVTGKKPPQDPDDPQTTNFREAVIWSAVSGALIGLARVVARRRAAQFYAKSAHEPEATTPAADS